MKSTATNAVDQMFDDWRKAIFQYMKDHKLTEKSKLPATYADLLRQLDIQERDLIARIKPLQVSKYQPYAYIDELIGEQNV